MTAGDQHLHIGDGDSVHVAIGPVVVTNGIPDLVSTGSSQSGPEASPTPKSKAAPKGKAASTGFPVTWPPPDLETPDFPPLPSSTGKKYYAFVTPAQLKVAGDYPRPRCLGPFVAAGEACAKQRLGGTWTGAGPCPKGFEKLEDAVAECLLHTKSLTVPICLW